MYLIIMVVAFVWFIYTLFGLISHLMKGDKNKGVSDTYPEFKFEVVTKVSDKVETPTKEIMELLEKGIRTSGYFKEEKIPDLLADLKRYISTSDRINIKGALDGSVLLSVEEKKSLGLNAKMKYSKRFIEYFNPSVFETIEPRSAVENLYLNAFHKVSRKNELLKMKRDAGIKQIRVVAGECSNIKKLRKKIYGIDEVPELPLSDCDCNYCLCYFEPIIP
ncbi:MAG: hypothetical protein HOO95_08730 [Gallionella sp.]|nr:hypothetical protein [Gallionella sp.]